jgi:gas vesicle protein
VSSTTPSKTSTETIFDNLGADIKDSFDKLDGVMKQSVTDVMQIKVQTADASSNVLYSTIIAVDGSVSNVFQATQPDATDEYWKRHNALVDQAVQNRNQLMLKVIETVGGVFKISPV